MESGLTRQIDQMYEITPEGIEALVKKEREDEP
jgi:hypothetical protein